MPKSGTVFQRARSKVKGVEETSLNDRPLCGSRASRCGSCGFLSWSSRFRYGGYPNGVAVRSSYVEAVGFHTETDYYPVVFH